ncbi:MAG: SdpI family protein [Christensenellaceae bacterium]|jgi:uncharacterized membrane protein|nr:SdpI family protein [Christensenellaceae bacterium]
MMKRKGLVFAVLALNWLALLLVVRRMPAQIPMHVNLRGVVDGMGPNWWLLGFGALPAAVFLLLFALPKIDPFRQSWLKHEKAYERVLLALLVFFVLIGWLVASLGFGGGLGTQVSFRFESLLCTGLGLLFLVIGNHMGQLRQNWFFGIRTPWTLASETVWRKTHRLGAYAFVLCGALALIGAVLGLLTGLLWLEFTLAIAPVLLAAVWLTVYSYLLFQTEQRQKEGPDA